MSALNPDGFRHDTAKHRVVAWINQNLFDNVTYTVNHGLIKGMKRKGGLAWLPGVLMGSANTPELSFWIQQDLKDQVIYDIGAFHGLLTLFFARQGRQVISYEPNTRNRARLMENLRLNALTNVRVRPMNLGSKSELATMVVSPVVPGGPGMEQDTVAGSLNSNTAVFSERISITTLDDDIREHSLPLPDLVKIDVEGSELSVLAGARNLLSTHKPRLFLKMHGETMNIKLKKVGALVDCLIDLGYREIRHIESGALIDRSNSALAAEGHLYCPF